MTTRIYETAVQAHSAAVAGLASGAWDLQSFLQNAKNYVQTAGGALLMLVGTAALVWGGVLLVKKLMSPAQGGQHTSWGTIVMLVLIGGALATGGWTLISKVGSGGQTTITQLGGGSIVRVHSHDVVGR